MKVLETIQRAYGKTKLTMIRKSPEITLGLSIATGIAAVGYTVWATIKAVETYNDTVQKLEQAERVLDNEEEKEDAVEKIKIHCALEWVKLYAPAIALETASILFTVKSHKIMKGRNTALVMSVAAATKELNDYRQRVRDVIGDEQEKDIFNDASTFTVTHMHEDGTSEEEVIKKNNHESQYAAFFDASSDYWEKDVVYNLSFLRTRLMVLNNEFRKKGHMFLNEVYRALGLPETVAGQYVGWVLGSTNGDGVIKFIDVATGESIEDIDDLEDPVVLLDFNVDGDIIDILPEVPVQKG